MKILLKHWILEGLTFNTAEKIGESKCMQYVHCLLYPHTVCCMRMTARDLKNIDVRLLKF